MALNSDASGTGGSTQYSERLPWADGDKKGGFPMQCDKIDYRGILAALEGVIGKKVVNSESLTVKY